ncbi:MAG: hypothetical protein KDA66_08030 [Planctomycetaceae bacterium]|nr:hypothetical protein [Planctomycetaceae bacterium]
MTTERPWYQRGWTLIIILILLAVFGPPYYRLYQFTQLAKIRPQLTGRVEQPFFGTPVLHLNAWHQHAGNLQNGVLSVIAEGPNVVGEDHQAVHIHSFEIWEPNEEHALAFPVPLTEFDPNQEITVSIILKAKNCHLYFAVAKWKGREWTELSEHWPELEKLNN